MKSSVAEQILWDYANSYKNTLELHKELPASQSRLVEITKKILLHLYEGGPSPDLMIDTITEDDLNEDIYATFNFYLAWAALNLQRENLEQADAIYKRLNKIEFAPSRVNHIINFFKSRLLDSMHYHHRRFDLFRKNLKKQFNDVDSGTPLYFKAVSNFLHAQIDFEDVKEYKKILQQIHKESLTNNEITSIYQFYNLLSDLINLKHVDTSHFDDLPHLISDAIMKTGYMFAKEAMAELIHVNSLFNDIPQKVLDDYPLNDELCQLNFQTLQCLCLGQPQEALQFADVYWQKHQNVFDNLMIRVNIANKRPETANHLLDKKTTQAGSLSYLDHFFKARIFLLNNKKEKARLHFHTSLKLAQDHGVTERILNELKMSCELSLTDFFELMSNSSFLSPMQNIRNNDQFTLNQEIKHEHQEIQSIDRIIGSGLWYKNLSSKIQKFSALEHVVLITGETGTGKEMVARALHEAGPRKDKPFIAINCGAFTKFLLESELFGHSKGAFTGADKARRGLIEEAAGGTLFLDEIGDMAPELQVSLLRILENREYRPVGSNMTKKSSCRIVCATHQNLEELSHTEGFRKDLYYRLSALNIHLPSLQERKTDIKLLAQTFLSDQHAHGQHTQFTDRLITALEKYQWPGNIRELKNEIEYMKVMNQDKTIYDLEDLRPDFTKRLLSDGLKRERALSENDASFQPSYDPFDDSERIKLSRKKRRQTLEELFQKHQKLSRQKICHILNISPATATNDLKILADRGVISKVCPTTSPRTHYFIANSSN